MGIKNLSSLYKDDTEIKREIHLKNFSGTRIAIDGGTWMNSLWCSACARHIDEIDVIEQELDSSKIMGYWLDRIGQELKTFLSYDIVPLIVLDGTPPQEKEATRAKRREAIDKARSRLGYLEDRKGEFYTAQEIEQARKLLKTTRPVPMVSDTVLETLLRAIGIPCLRCRGEAERLCANLCREGWAWATLSTDTDSLVHGCTQVIVKTNGKTCTSVHLYPLLDKLGLTYPQFVDLCILCGCDYNNNIPRVGVQRSLALIKEYGSIDNLPDKYDRTPLNYLRCRELFSLVDCSSLTDEVIDETSVNIGPISEEARDILDSYNASHWLTELVPLLKKELYVPRLSYIRNPQPCRIQITS
jgi:flap endonuclease-1